MGMVGFVDRCPLLEKDLDHLGPALATSSGQHYNQSWIIGMSLNVVNKRLSTTTTKLV